MSTRGVVTSVCVVGLVLVELFCAPQSRAQLALGNVQQSSISSASCSTLSSDRGGFDSGYVTSCYKATLSGCPNINNTGFIDNMVFFYGIAPAATTTALGTIVLLPGNGGTQMPPDFSAYLASYVNAGYQVIEVVWGENPNGQDWEYVNSGGGSNTLSIMSAACRPASLLNWIRNGSDKTKVGQGLWAQTGGGMCVHADSAGAGAVGYSLAWYNGGAGGAPTWGGGYIDKAVLENGPVFSDIQQGCEFTNGQNTQSTYICDSSHGDYEPGCAYWPPPSVQLSLEYVDGDQNSVNFWSQDQSAGACSPAPTPACAANITAHSTCTAQNQAWANMSIVANSNGTQVPSFSYPNTAMSGWACSNVENNSAPQAQLFFYQFQNLSVTRYSFNGAVCSGPEQVEGATFYVNNNPYQGKLAFIYDMLGTHDAPANLSCSALGTLRNGS